MSSRVLGGIKRGALSTGMDRDDCNIGPLRNLKRRDAAKPASAPLQADRSVPRVSSPTNKALIRDWTNCVPPAGPTVLDERACAADSSRHVLARLLLDIPAGETPHHAGMDLA